MIHEVHIGDNLPILRAAQSGSVDFVYMDPPFNTGKPQAGGRMRFTQDAGASRKGFGGKAYAAEKLETFRYVDKFTDYLGFIQPRIFESWRLLKPTGSMFVHLDFREVHYVKVLMDEMFGRDCFINEIIWAYDYGGRSKTRWSPKHDNILWYAKDPSNYTFNFDAIDRIPYMAPNLVGADKAERGKTPTDVHWHTIVPTNGKERTGYPTQKPLGLLERFIQVHTNVDDIILDPFAGSGSTGVAAIRNGRGFILIDSNPEAEAVIRSRMTEHTVTFTNHLTEAAPDV